MVGIGPGVMQGNVQNNPAGKYRIQWTREFGFEPAENGQYRASLQGGATVRMAGMGEITASDRLDAAGRLAEEGRIFAWLSPITKMPAPSNVATIRPVSVQVAQGKPELPTGPRDGRAGTDANPAGPNSTGPNSTGSENWQLERVLAQGNVRIDVPQLDGATDKLEVWVERPQATAAAIDPGARPRPPTIRSNRSRASLARIRSRIRRSVLPCGPAAFRSS